MEVSLGMRSRVGSLRQELVLGVSDEASQHISEWQLETWIF